MLLFSPNIECKSGTYGENCTYQCGECINAVSCDHVDGTCSEGCKPGWQMTDTCHERMCTFLITYSCLANIYVLQLRHDVK